MKAISRVIPSLFFLAVILAGCSRKKNTFIGRNFHAVTAEYNALYNGYNALEDGRSSLNESYNDNYWELLPIERMQVSEEISLPGQSKNPNFERAEEKAVKAIQKHAIKVQGKEYNPQMDEAYLLLGKARYFDQRFVPALDAFNNILNDYPTSDKINQVKIWREKTNIRLENDEVAIKNLKRLLEQEKLEKQDLADATSMLAQAYINTKSLDSALMQMKVASIATKDNEEKGRYNFIKGQLYNMLEFRDSANIAFDEVIELNRKTPRIYMISAYIEKAKNFDYEDGNKLEFLEHLTDLEENRENRPFLDKIYHQIAVFHETNESDTLATKYYNKSLRALSQDRYLQSRNYLALGDMNFDNAQYQMAGAYYDSTMTKLVENSKPYRIIKRKRDNLDDVILYELGSQRNDSILNLVSLSDEDRLAFFESYIADLKAKAEAEKEREAIAERNKGLIQDGQTLGNRIGQERESGEPFYFYNATSVAFGKNEFIKVWGDRPLEDNWRSSGQGISSLANASEDSAILTASEEELMDPEFYISKIPKDEKVIDSITRERNFAYYQLGLIYKEKFTEYELAKDKLQKLLRNGPEERL
ncbi:MAG: tetratricopeptide repeat protein, partial [Flavobacteriaceae bacterium]|nr:tetratricopeptide repeat protein [Flavobacteriaceae bacterium]